MTEVLSYGGGVNSTALAILLINEGWKGPLVFADTSSEWPETYEFMDFFEQDWLKPRGFEIIRLHPKFTPEFYRKRYRMPLYDYCWQYHMVPLVRARFCTRLYKTLPIAAWCKKNGIETQLLAIDAGEAHRMPQAQRPLVGRGIDRAGCKSIIREAGLVVPHKSGCYFCPMKSRWRWRVLWAKHPDLYDKAVALEENASNHDVRRGALDPSGKITLRQRLYTYEHQMELSL